MIDSDSIILRERERIGSRMFFNYYKPIIQKQNLTSTNVDSYFLE